MTLKAKIAHIKTLEKGAFVSMAEPMKLVNLQGLLLFP